MADEVKVEHAVADEEIVPVPERFVLKPLPGVHDAEAKRGGTHHAAKEEASQSPFSVTVGQVYDGPLDLLLDLIRKQNIDIYDIPIALITAQFLDYCHQLKQTDVDAAGEFIYMASLLIHIKSKTLLPRDPSDVVGADAEDPRRELVERLLEHERFKAAAQMLRQKQQVEEATWSNPGMREFLREQEGPDGSSLDDEQEMIADTVDLVRVFQDVLERLRERPVLDVNEESVTVAQMIDYVKRRLLMEDRPVSLRRLLHSTHSERALICMFLAMLELVRLQAVLLHQPSQLGDILIKKTDGFDQVFAEQERARDDWR
jgi:segregation and condensation protein A